jgi:exopolysaccharide production protein ExoZ
MRTPSALACWFLAEPANAYQNRPAGKTQDLLSIQALRAIAAFSICLVHFETLYRTLSGMATTTLVLIPLTSGVDLFFVISGFVMVYSSDELFGRADSPLRFLRKRLARIVPLYWVVTAIGLYLGIWLGAGMPDAESIIKSILFVPFVNRSGAIQPIYGVGWTLNFEMFFYLVFAGTLLLRRQIAILVACGFLIGIVILGALFQPTSTILAYWSEPIILEFVFGMIAAILFHWGIRLPPALGWLLCIIGVIALSQRVPGTLDSNRWLTCGLPAAAVFTGLVLRRPLPAAGFRWLGALGDASYSIYLLHVIVIAIIYKLWPSGPTKWVVLATGLALTVIISLGSYRWFEKPVSRLIQNFPKKKRYSLEAEQSGAAVGVVEARPPLTRLAKFS